MCALVHDPVKFMSMHTLYKNNRFFSVNKYTLEEKYGRRKGRSTKYNISFCMSLKNGILSYFVDWFDHKVARMGWTSHLSERIQALS
jgi:hypothetical protein